MSVVVENWEQLKLYINAVLKDCIKEIATETQFSMQQYLLTNWYGAYVPISYYRTYELIDSLTHSEIKPKFGGGFNIAIFFDVDKIVPNITGMGFNQHLGFDQEEPFTYGLIDVVEDGNPNAFPRNVAHISEGIHIFKETSEWLEKELPNIAKKVFAKYGLNLITT